MAFEGALFSLFQQPKEGQINNRTLPFKNSTARQFARSSRARPEVFRRRARLLPNNQFLLARILMVFGFASSFFGRVSVSTPSLYSAVAFSASTELGKAKERVKDP